MLRSFLLVPCLLICVSCATPFPLDSLEEGMTMETVRENFGAPEAIETGPEGTESSWKYLDERLSWQMFIFPQALLSIPICAAIPDKPWDCVYTYSVPVLLRFEGKKLARWEVIEPVDSGSGYYDPFWQQQFWSLDAHHHAAGHTHHHPGC